MKNIVVIIIGVGILCIWAVTTRNLAVENKQKAERLQAQVDSLQSENFILKNQIGRYELTIDYLQEVNPKAALQATNYLNHETE